MKAAELRALSPADLQQKLEEAAQELLNLRFQLATRQLTNNQRIPYVKRTIALIKTLLSERDLGVR
ncbi:MAG: 50S ribosomal protein L29 [Chloroflexi bacterium]|nr:50S ribosomal protein L29 [Chloroflexota bacterium]